jgi:subtilisin-like proprotein convertase family protein
MSRPPHSTRALIVAAGLACLLGDPGPTVAAEGSFANIAPITIQDNGPATPYPSTITASGLGGTITTVTVTLATLSHTFSEDIDILLVGPGGQSVLLVSDVGASTTTQGATLVLDDDAPASLPGAGRITSGTFRPTNLNDSNTLPITPDVFPAPAPAPPYDTELAVFAGTDPNGSWQLFVRDDAHLNEGSLARGWCLTITTDAPGGASTGCALLLTPGLFGLSVTKTGPGLGTVTGTDVTGLAAGILCGTDCVEAYAFGTPITLEATGRRGSGFGGWSGGCAGTGDCAVTLNADTTVNAAFPAPSDRPVILEPEADDAPLTAGDRVTFRWTDVPGASQYGFEFTCTSCAFANPGGRSPDIVNGFGGTGGGFPVPGTTFPIPIPADIPPGTYQVRVVGLTPGLAFVGRFSEAVTVLFGHQPGGQPALTAPADGSPISRGSPVTFAWTAVPDAARYLFEFTGTDPGGLGGTLITPTPDTSLPAIVPTDIPAGPYRIRVLGLTAEGAPVGQFSPALTVILQ